MSSTNFMGRSLNWAQNSFIPYFPSSTRLKISMLPYIYDSQHSF